ncbi:MAG: HypC/HybG/HupF family hydrogenase formation chaperone [Candidatus Omnitrophota bacterium]
MCLAVPLKIVEIQDKFAIAKAGSLKRMVNIEMLDKVRVGDYCLVHAGFAIKKVDIKQAKKTMRILNQLGHGPKR